MESPGTYLKRERELRGVSLDAMHEAVRVPKKYLVALEADDYASLPHPAFVKGFIKTYCRHLGVDETDAALRFEMYMREVYDKAAPPSAEAVEAAKPWRPPAANNIIIYLAAAGVAVIIIAYAVFSHRGPQPAENAAPAAPAVALPQAGAATATSASVPASAKPEQPKTAAAQPKGAGAAPAKATDAPRPAVKEAARPRTEAPQVAARQSSDGFRHTLSMTAVDTVWVKVRIDNDEPFDVTLRKDEKAVWKAREVISVLIGNAGGVEAYFDDEKLPPLGARGEVVNFILPRGAAAPDGARDKPRANGAVKEAW